MDWLGFGGSLISSFLGNSAADDQREAENQRFASNLAYQREFAQNGIQWKVNDARAAGIHPMAALGANTVSYSPMALGDIGSDLRKSSGQDLGRAVSAISTSDTKDKDFNTASQKLILEKGSLENELLKQQVINSRRQSAVAAVTPQSPDAKGPPMSVMLGGDLPPSNPLKADDQMKEAPPPEHIGTRAGRTWLHNPYFSDAQKVEDRYGDIAEELYGLVNLLSDAGYNWYKSPYWGPGGTLDRKVYRRFKNPGPMPSYGYN